MTGKPRVCLLRRARHERRISHGLSPRVTESGAERGVGYGAGLAGDRRLLRLHSGIAQHAPDLRGGAWGRRPIEFPSAFGVHVAGGPILLLNIHLNNLADTSVTDSTRIEARIGTAADVTTPIDMQMAGTFLINIPSDGQMHTATGICVASRRQSSARLPAAHAICRQASDRIDSRRHHDACDLRSGFRNAARELHAARHPDPILTGDQLTTVCSYINNSGGTLNYGECSDNESCFAAIYRYPTSATSSLYDCAEGLASFDVKRE